VEHEQRLLAEIKQRDAEQAKDKVTNILDELKRFNEELERRVAQRTEQLQQANAALVRDMEQRKKLENQLVQAQKMESVGTLAGGIAHDFNNLLNIIQGYAFILRGHCEQNEEMEQSLVAINDTVQRGSALVHQLLTLGRRSRGIGLKPVDINILVERLIVLIRQTFPKTIELDHILETDIPPIAGDKNQIEQALLNLCVNARDAMANRGTLMFKTHSVTGAMLQHLGEDLEGPYVCIEVTDTGVGMDEKVRSRIFEPFFTTKKKGQGTGLGLSVVYGIVKNHDGFIDVDSKPMAGTSFRLYFPAQAADAAVHEPITKVDAQPAVASNSSATVLIVEDEEMMLHALGKILGEQGYKVLKASDGEMALETYQRHKDTIDVVLLDLGLPKMSGRDVLLRMKNKNPDVKVVIASGHFEDELNSDIDQAGVKHLLRKPYMPDELIKILQSLTKRN
jgi:signal transduction histidine kinase/CheY-like chemotaxis protein